MKINNITILLIILLFLPSCRNTKLSMESEKFVIQKKFEGIVVVFYANPKGVSPIVENGKYIYFVPNNGILKVKDSLNEDISQIEFYYTNEAYSLPYIFDYTNIKNDSIYVFKGEVGRHYEKGEIINYKSFIVSSKVHSDSLIEKMNNLNPYNVLFGNGGW